MTLAEILEEYADEPLSPAGVVACRLRDQDPVLYEKKVSAMRSLARTGAAENYCTTVERCLEAVASPYVEVRIVGLRRITELKGAR